MHEAPIGGEVLTQLPQDPGLVCPYEAGYRLAPNREEGLDEGGDVGPCADTDPRLRVRHSIRPQPGPLASGQDQGLQASQSQPPAPRRSLSGCTADGLRARGEIGI